MRVRVGGNEKTGPNDASGFVCLYELSNNQNEGVEGWGTRTFSEFLHQPCDNITVTFPMADGVTRELVGYIKHRRAAQQLTHQPWFFVRAALENLKKYNALDSASEYVQAF